MDESASESAAERPAERRSFRWRRRNSNLWALVAAAAAWDFRAEATSTCVAKDGKARISTE